MLWGAEYSGGGFGKVFSVRGLECLPFVQELSKLPFVFLGSQSRDTRSHTWERTGSAGRGSGPGQRPLTRWLGTIGSDFKWSLSQVSTEQLWGKPPREGPNCPGTGQHLPSLVVELP